MKIFNYCFSQKESWRKESEDMKEEKKKLEEQKEQDATKIKAYSVSNFVAFIFQKVLIHRTEVLIQYCNLLDGENVAGEN